MAFTNLTSAARSVLDDAQSARNAAKAASTAQDAALNNARLIAADLERSQPSPRFRRGDSD